MEICDDNHEEIVFERAGKYGRCPLCKAVERINDLEEDLGEAREEINDHECEPPTNQVT